MNEALLRQCFSDPAAFRRILKIDTYPPKSFADVIEPWQRCDFESMDPAWRRIAGCRDAPPATNKAYLERPRGHSKTTDLAVMALWAIAFSSRRLTGVAAAGDQDQAKLLRDAIERLVRQNRWLLGTKENPFVRVNKYEIVNKRTGSTLSILSADVQSSWGHLPDFVICDELSVWAKEPLWHSLFSASIKRPDCVLVVITNAGVGKGESWHWRVREAARESAGWYFHSLDGPQASWIKPSDLEEQRRMLPPSVYARLWLNQWVKTSGDFITLEEAAACRDEFLEPSLTGYPGIRYIASVDYGEKRDRAVGTVLHRRKDTIFVDRMDVFVPARNKPVLVSDIEEWMIAMHAAFHPHFVIDPWQLAGTDQRLSAQGLSIERWNASGPSQANLAKVLRSLITNVRLRWYPGCGQHANEDLESELASLVVRQTSSGWRFDHTASGHDDRCVGLGMGCCTALNQPVQQRGGPYVWV